jgi:hypothetical protein
MRFSDVLRAVTNPKLAQDCLQPLVKAGLVLHEERGSAYRASPRGRDNGVLLTSAISLVLEALDREPEGGP